MAYLGVSHIDVAQRLSSPKLYRTQSSNSVSRTLKTHVICATFKILIPYVGLGRFGRGSRAGQGEGWSMRRCPLLRLESDLNNEDMIERDSIRGVHSALVNSYN